MRLELGGALCLMSCAAAQPPSPPPCEPVIEVPVAGLLPGRCARIEGSDVGRLPLSVHPGGGEVTLAEWTHVDAATEAVVGFAAVLPPDVVYAVSAGERVSLGAGPRWLDPRGVLGAQPIDSITFCRVPRGTCPGAAVAITGSPGAAILASF